jgi:hypothetical protein
MYLEIKALFLSVIIAQRSFIARIRYTQRTNNDHGVSNIRFYIMSRAHIPLYTPVKFGGYRKI